MSFVLYTFITRSIGILESHLFIITISIFKWNREWTSSRGESNLCIHNEEKREQ